MNRFLLALSIFSAQWATAQQMSWTTPCIDQEFCINWNACDKGQVFMTEKAVTNCNSPNINYSYRIDLNNNGSFDIQSPNDTLAGEFNKGTHKVVWRATDNCGNVIQCTYLFVVKDCQPPNFLCINGLTQGLQVPECTQTFMASQFVLSMSDNCTPTNQLQLGLRLQNDGTTGFPAQSSIQMDSCDEGFRLVEVWVRDGNGLSISCNNYVLVQDNNNKCNCNIDGDVELKGCTQTALGGLKINEYRLKATVESVAGSATPFQKSYSKNVTDSCFAEVIDKIPFGQSYVATIWGEKKLGPLVGVTTYDLVLMSKHILAIEPFTSVYQTVAADVNRSNSVTTFDIVETRKLILGIYDTFPKVPAWRFVRPVANPTQVANFAALQDTYQLVLNNLSGDLLRTGFDFIGIKYGDVNGSAQLTGEASEERYLASPMLFRTQDRWLEAGEETIIHLSAAEAAMLEGWQLALEADPEKLRFLNVEGLPEDHFVLRPQHFRALWADGEGQFWEAGQNIFSLKIKAVKAIRLSEALWLDNRYLRPEAYSVKANGKSERHALRLHFGEKTNPAATFFAPRPNPFSSETAFEILLKKPATLQLEIFDLNGQRVFAENFDMEAGLQTLLLPGSKLPGAGVFAYRLHTGNAVTSGRLVKI